VLTLAAPEGSWKAATADRRTEWSYASAFAESLRWVV
jgi:hypothetical protein